MIRVIFNQKGGVGKTSITSNIAASFALLGKRVLLIDIDPQANSSQYLLGERYENLKVSIADFFNSSLKINIFNNNLRETVCKTDYHNLSVIPSSPALVDLQSRLESKYKVMKLKQALSELVEKRSYDEVLIDTPPALNFYSMSALIAAERILIPFDCDAFSAGAIFQVLETLDEVVADYQPKLSLEGVIANQFQVNAKLPKQSIDDLRDRGIMVLRPYLSSSVQMRESHRNKVPLVHDSPKHKLSLEFMQLARGLLEPKLRKEKRNTNLNQASL